RKTSTKRRLREPVPPADAPRSLLERAPSPALPIEPARRMLSSLDIPDDAVSRIEPPYSLIVGEALTRAYSAVAGAPAQIDAYRLAQISVFPYLPLPMSERQRMRIFYILGMAYVATDDLLPALGCLYEAMEVALRLNDLGACAECAYLVAAIMSSLEHF